MNRKYNKGVTLVEVLIALAVFLILMLPLVSSLITSVKTTDSGKELQSRNDFAEVLMEDVKNASIDDLKDSTKVSQLLDGSKNVSVSTSANATHPTEKDITITGNTYLGTKKTKYSYKIEAIYDKKTNAYGIMDDLDPYKSAFVPVTFSNYDEVATEAIVTQKLAASTGDTIFVDKDKVDSLHIDASSHKNDSFREFTADREVTVKVSGSKASGFTVECEITYTDKDNISSWRSGKTITYKPYKQEFKNCVPNIYLMYNAGVYNNKDTKDSIKFDLSGITTFAGFGEKERINAFIIRTSEDYADIIDNFKKSDGTFDNTRFNELTDLLSDKLKNDIKNEADGTSSKKLYKGSSSGNRNNNVTIKGGSSVSKDRFRVYHNLFYKDASGTLVSLVTKDANIANNVDSIDNAHEEVWSIYNVKIWIQEGDSVNSDDNMVTLQGTRGGGEIE